MIPKKIKVYKGKYNNSRLAIQLGESYDPYAILTVNLTSSPISGPDCAYVDTNNLPEAEKFIKARGLGEPTGMMAASGFCTYPEYKFNLDKLEEE